MARYRVVQADQVVLGQGVQWGWVVETVLDDGRKTIRRWFASKAEASAEFDRLTKPSP
jgi:hypothetical protein